MEMSLVATLFPGIASLFVQDPVIACARIFMIIFGFILAYLGFKRNLRAFDHGTDGCWYDLYQLRRTFFRRR